MIIAFDTETTGLDPWHGCKPYIMSGIDDQGAIKLWRFRVDPFTRNVEIPNSDRLEMADYLWSADELVGHNVKFDLRMLEVAGLAIPDSIWSRVHDTILMSHCVHSAGPHGLKELALQHLDILDDDEQDLRTAALTCRRYAGKTGWSIAEPGHPHWPAIKNAKPGFQWWKSDMWMPREFMQRQDDLKEFEFDLDAGWWDICEVYARRDVERTIGLYFFFQRIIQELGLEPQYEIRRQNIEATYKMESRGLGFRKFLAQPVQEKHAKLSLRHEQECFKVVNHQIDNLDSPKQLQSALYNILNLPVINRTEKSQQPATDKDTLAELQKVARPTSKAAWFLRHLPAYRKRSHAAETVESYRLSCLPLPYDESILKEAPFARLHPSHNMTGTSTTRGSSSDPNGQNIAKGEGLPKEEKFNLRDLFGPEPGRVWYSHDYSNIELRIFSMLAGEKEWLDAFERGESVHLLVAKELYPDIFDENFKTKYPHYYQWVKNGNFSLTYGAGPKTADATYHVPGAYRKVRKRFKEVDRFMDVCIKEAKQYGYVTTLGGYRLDVPLDRVYTTAVDYKVQGSAGYAMNIAKNRVTEYWRDKPDHYLIMEIHDELLNDVPQVHDPHIPWDIQRLMEQSGDDLGLPLPVEMGIIRTSWDQDEDVLDLRPTRKAPPPKKVAV